eukprot:7491961-Pyramimonas_sp.AAC.1
MAMVRAKPPRPRCKAAASWEGVMLPVVPLIQACTSRTNSRKGTWPAGPQWGPVVLASSPPRICPTARPIATHVSPKIPILIKWPHRSWSDVVGQ